MSKPCPIFGRAIYADCLDCDIKECRNIRKHNIKLSKGDIINVGINEYMIYCGMKDGKRILFDVLQNKRIYVNSNYLSKYKEVKKV